VTYAELEERSRRAASALAASGVGPGQRVKTTMPAGLAFAELLYALPKLGAVLEPLAPTGRPHEPGAVLGEAAKAGAVDTDLRDRLDPGETHSVIRTSGTTGTPKEVELTYANHLASARAVADRLGAEPGDRWLCVLPTHHVGGLAILLRSVIHRATAVVHPRFDAGRAKAELEGGEVTLVSLVPTMLHRLRDAGLRRAPALRAVLLGGAPVPAELVAWAEAAGLPVVPVYGMTETASLVAAGSPARALPGVELRIGEEEEILVRGPAVAPGAIAADGWLHTGDRGSLDSGGHLRVEGRIKELIVTGGEKVSPVEVEQALTMHPAVADAGVVGLPDPEWGEVVTAFVVLDAAATAEELAAHLRERLPPHKVPKRIEQVAGLPRNAAGKLLRDEIAPDGPRPSLN
jgi:O-succinylbenzoic acid--CoA ligase